MKVTPLQTILLALVCQAVWSGRLMPDLDKAISTMTNDAAWNAASLMFHFKLGDSSPGLHTDNYIGIDFTPTSNSVDVAQNISFTNTNFSCALSDSSGNSIAVANGNTAAGQIAYCKVTEKMKTKMLMKNTSYVLTLMSMATFAKMSVNQIGLFTTTSLSTGAFKLDANNVFGSVHLYSSFTAPASQPLIFEGTDFSKMVTAGTATAATTPASTTVYPGDTFETHFKLTVSARIPMEYDILITHTTHFGAFTGITSMNLTDTSTDPLELAMKGDLSPEVISPGMIRIKGRTEELIPGRKFRIKFTGWTGLMPTGTAQPLSIWVRYKNSNTFFSYSTNTTLMLVSNVMLSSSSVMSSDYHAWLSESYTYPIEIALKPNVTMENVNVKISYTDTTNKIGFNAASCNFTKTARLDHVFENRPVCHSLGKTNADASGFHFFVDKLDKDETFKFDIFTHFSKCGTQNNLLHATDSSSSKFKFKVEVYKTVTNMGADSARLSSLWVSQDTVDSTFTCSAAMIDSTNALPYYGPLNISDETIAGNKLYFISRELTDLMLYDVNSSIDTDVDVFAMTSNTGNVPGFSGTTTFINTTSTPRVYLYSTSNQVQKNAMPAIIAKSNMTVAERQIWPSDIVMDGTYATALQGHSLHIAFQKHWFAAGRFITDFDEDIFSETCFTSWKLSNTATMNFSEPLSFGTDTNPDTAAKTKKVFEMPQYQVNRTILFQGKSNFTNLAAGSIIDATTHYTLTGVVGVDTSNNVAYRWPCAGNCGAAVNKTFFGLFTTCLKFKSDFSPRRLFDYFEVMMTYNDSTGRPKRMLRLISYLPMTGIFDQDPRATDYDSTKTMDFSQNVSYSAGYQNVCILKMAKDNFLNATTDGNVFVLYLFNITLFETDFASYNNQYPIAGTLGTDAKAYGLSTAYPVQDADFRIANTIYDEIPTTYADKDIADFFLFSSQIWITKVSETGITFNGTNTDDLYVPHYCTEPNSDSSQSINMVFGQWIFSQSYDYVQHVKRRLVDNTGKKYFRTNTQTIQKITDFKDTFFYAYNQFSNYNSGLNKITAVPSKHVKMTGSTVSNYTTLGYVTYLLSSSIELDTAVTISNLGTETTRMSTGVPFYFMGKKFDKLILGVFSTAIKLFGTDNSDSIGFSVTGVKPPALSSIVSATGAMTLANHIVIAGGDVSAGKAINNLSGGNYYVSFEQAAYDWVVGYGNLDTAYYVENGAIQMTFSNPTAETSRDKLTFPIGTPFTFSFDTTLAETAFCLIDQSSTTFNYYGNMCSKATNTFTCPFSQAASTFKVCCYNVKLLSTTTSFSVATASVAFASPSTNHVSYDLFNETTFANPLTMAATAYPQPVVTSYSFPYTASKGGMSNMHIAVDMKKRLDYDLEIHIEGDMSKLSLFNLTPHCTATTSNTYYFGNWAQGDNIIDSCKVENFNTSSSMIKIFTKMTAFSCSQTNSTMLYVNLWPIKPEDISASKLKVIVMRASKQTNIISPATGVDLTNLSTDDTTLMVDTNLAIASTMCNLKTVYPLLVGAKADFTFEFNYFEKKTEMDALTVFPNEVTVLLPSQFDSYNMSYLKCSTSISGVTDVDCSVNHGMLTANIKAANFKTDTSKFTITVHNLAVPTFGPGILKFYCSMNTHLWNGSRKVKLTGRGEYAGKAEQSTMLTALLNFDNSAENTYISKEPRSGSMTMNFGLRLDTAGGVAMIDRVLGNNPYFLFELPSSYTNTKYAGTAVASTVMIEVKEITRNTTASGYAFNPPKTIAKDGVMQYGNTFKVPIISNSTTDTPLFNLSKETIYYTVEIAGVMAPEMQYPSAGNMNVYITNDASEYLMRTYQNISTSHNIMIPGAIGLDVYYRGYSFKYSMNNWIVDFMNSSTTHSNEIELIAGYYNPIYAGQMKFDMLQVNSDTVQMKLEGELTHKIIQNGAISADGMFTYTSAMGTNMFHIGVPCKTAPGRYLLKVTVMNGDKANKFVPQMMVHFYVKHKPMSITCPNQNISASKDSTFSFNCSNPWPLYDDYTLAFANANANDNFSGAAVTVEKYASHNRINIMTTFTENKSTTTNLTFNMTTGNECLYINGTSTATYSLLLNDEDPKIPVETDLGDIIFHTTVNNSAIPHGNIKFSAIFPATTHMACVLTCTGMTMPADDIIESQTGLMSSDSMIFFKLYSSSSTTPHEITVGHFKASKTYNMRCMIKSGKTTGTPTKFFKDLNSIKKSREEGATLSPIGIGDTKLTKCVKFTLTDALNPLHQQELVNYCQNTMNHNTPSGCLKCANHDNTVKPAGIALSGDACTATPSLRRLSLGFLQSPTEEPNTVEEPTRMLQTSATYTVCAAEETLCSMTPLTQASYDAQMTAFLGMLDSATKVTALLAKAAPVPFGSAEIISDAAMPTFKSCSATETDNGCVVIGSPTFDFSGSVSVSLTFKDSFTCAWSVLLKEGSPSASTILSCSGGACGAFMSSNGVAVSLSGSTTFERQREYAIYISCAKRTILNTRFSSTQVLEIASKSFPKSEVPCPKPELDVTPDASGCACMDVSDNQVDQGTDGTICVSSTWLSLSAILLFFLLI